MKKIIAMLFVIFVFIIFTYGYSRLVYHNKYEISYEDYKVYIKSFNSAKDIINDGINNINDSWKDYLLSLSDFGDINFNWSSENNFGGNILNILTSIFNILKYPIKLIINGIVFLYNIIAIFIYYIVALIQWSAGIGGAL